MAEQRRFSRIAFEAAAVLEGPGGRQEARVLDLSLKGVLLHLAEPPRHEPDQDYILTIPLSPVAKVTMSLALAHAGSRRAGFVCTRIDLDSLGHLRRLAEFNLGDAELLQRELADLLEE